MPTEPADIDIELRFTEDDCEQCDRPYPVALGCQHCGTDPLLDPHVQRRTSIVASALAILEGDDSASSTLAPEAELDDREPFAEWIVRLRELLALVAEEQDVTSDLRAHVEVLVAWREQLAAAPRLRPNIWRVDMLRQSVAALTEATGSFLRAVSVPSGEAALVFGQTAQQSIDAGTDLFNDLDQRLARRARTTGSDADSTATLLILMAEEIAGGFEIGADTAIPPDLAALYLKLTGESTCPIEAAMALKMVQVQIDMLTDRDRFWKCAGITYRRLTSTVSRGKAKFTAVIAHPNWIGHFHEVHKELQVAGIELQALLQNADPEVRLRALIRFGHMLAEEISPFLLATVLAAYKDRDYGTILSDTGSSFGALQDQARDAGLDSLLLGLDKALRHAGAHRRLQRIDLDNRIVHFTADHREYDSLTFDELTDRVLAGWESAQAMLTGIVIALILQDRAADLNVFDDLKFSATERIDFTLAGMRWVDRDIQLSGTSLTIHATVTPAPSVLACLIAIASHLEGIEDITLILKRDGNQETWSGPTVCLNSDQIPTEAALLRSPWFTRRWQRNGKTLADAWQARKAAAGILAHLVRNTSELGQIRLVAETGNFVARQLNDAPLVNATTNLVRWCSSRQAGTATEDHWQHVINQLMSLAAADVPPSPSG